jgi:hypothetical protein
MAPGAALALAASLRPLHRADQNPCHPPPGLNADGPTSTRTPVLQQIEILLEGLNPYADGPLTEPEQARLRGLLHAGETPAAFVRGRVVRAGAGLWVLTAQRLLLLQDGRRPKVDELPRAAVPPLTVQRGRYGSTLVLEGGGQRHAIFGAEPDAARAFANQLGSSIGPGV